MAFTTWNPSDKGANIVLSNADLTATASSPPADQIVRVIDSKTSGKFYFEFFGEFTVGPDNGLGIALAGATGPGMGGTGVDACCVFFSGNIWFNGAKASGNPSIGGISNNELVCCAVDFGANLIWFRVGATGQWNGSSSANPATGAGGVGISGLSGPWFIAGTVSGSTADTWTINTGASSFTGTVPSGFTSGWTGAGSAALPLDVRRNRTYLRR